MTLKGTSLDSSIHHLFTHSFAAEKQFGWSSEEVIENNINIKEMMPMRYAENHDDCKEAITN